MYKAFLLLVVFYFELFAATPKLFKPVGDPIYKEIPAVSKMAQMSFFKNQKHVLLGFVKKAQSHKRLGLSYDKKRRNNTLNKAEQKAYLDGLRSLKEELTAVYLIAQEGLHRIIKKNYIKTFYQLKKTNIGVLRLDPKSVSAIKNYDRRLNRKQKLAQQKKAAQEKEAVITRYNELRSAKNLNGRWKGKSSDGAKLLLVFKADRLSLHYERAKDTNIFKGKYSIHKNSFNFKIQQRKRIKADLSHIRKVQLQRNYQIKTITEKELVLSYKDELLRLKR